jgi:hypothetical protein
MDDGEFQERMQWLKAKSMIDHIQTDISFNFQVRIYFTLIIFVSACLLSSRLPNYINCRWHIYLYRYQVIFISC